MSKAFLSGGLPSMSCLDTELRIRVLFEPTQKVGFFMPDFNRKSVSISAKPLDYEVRFSFSSRYMLSGANRLYYNMYTDAARTVVWGDGTAGSSTVNGNVVLSLIRWASCPKYQL